MNRRTLFTALATAVALLLAALVLQCAASAAQPASTDIAARAPSLVVIIDHSSDAPAYSAPVMQRAAQRVGEIVATLQMGSKVYVIVAGDPLREVPLVLSSRVQARASARGATPAQIAAQIREFLLVEFPKLPRPDAKAGSSIILALRDAARLLNPVATDAAAPNWVYLVSDMLERSSLADCYRDCRLPKPDFKFVPGTRVEVRGIGLGLSDARSIALFTPWQKWFKEAGAELKLYRTY